MSIYSEKEVLKRYLRNIPNSRNVKPETDTRHPKPNSLALEGGGKKL